MIRIVDILKKAGEWKEENQPRAPLASLSADDAENILREAEGQIKSILEKDEPELLKKLSGPKYALALETTFHALKLGIDSNYSRQQLNELACAAIVNGIEPSPGRLRQIVGRSVSIESEEYKNIITLAEIYRQQKAPN